MAKVLKYQAEEAGPYSDGDVVHFVMPANGTVDLSKSYINIDVDVSDDNEVLANDATKRNAYHNLQLKVANNAQNYRIHPFTMVRNVSASNDKGKLEHIRNVNALMTNISQFAMDREEYYSQAIMKAGASTQFGQSVFRQLNRLGEITSQVKTGQIKIPLKQIMGLGLIKEYPSGAVGDTHFSLELQPSKLLAHEITMPQIDCYNIVNNTTAALPVNYIYLNTVHGGQQIDSTNIPCWVGQVVTVNFTNGAAAVAAVGRKIIKIEEVNEQFANTAAYVPAGGGAPARFNYTYQLGRIKVTFNAAIENIAAPNPTAAADATERTMSGINIENVAISALPTPVFSRAELVVYRSSTQVSKDSIVYPSFTSEEFSFDEVSQYQKQFYLEPNCINVMVMKPIASSLSSTDAHINSYRMRLEQKDLTDRDVVINSPLYYDRLSTTFGNAGLPLKNLDNGNGNTPSFVACNYVPLTNNSKVFSFVMQATAGNELTAGPGILYKQVEKVLQM